MVPRLLGSPHLTVSRLRPGPTSCRQRARSCLQRSFQLRPDGTFKSASSFKYWAAANSASARVAATSDWVRVPSNPIETSFEPLSEHWWLGPNGEARLAEGTFPHMNKDDLIFTLKVTALGVIALVMYVAVSYLRGGG